MAAKKPAAKKKAATTTKRTEQKTEVQADRRRSAPEKPDEPQGETFEGVEETRAYTPEELAELEHAARVAHNERTGGGPVREGELEEQRVVHTLRTGGVTLEEIEDQGVERASRGFKF